VGLITNEREFAGKTLATQGFAKAPSSEAGSNNNYVIV